MVEPVANHRPHSDDGRKLGATETRLSGVEKGVDDVRSEFRQFKQEVNEQFSESRQQTRDQLAGFRTDIFREITALGQDIRDSRGKGTNWGTIFTGATVVIILAGAVLFPINSSLSDAKTSFHEIDSTFKNLEQFYARRDDVLNGFNQVSKALDGLNDLITKNVTRKEHDEFAKRIDKRDEDERIEYFREIDRLSNHVNSLDGDLIKRPEIQALLDGLRGAIQALADNTRGRLDALSLRQDNTDRLIGSSYTQGDRLKEMQMAIESLQAKLFSILGQPSNTPEPPHAQ